MRDERPRQQRGSAGLGEVRGERLDRRVGALAAQIQVVEGVGLRCGRSRRPGAVRMRRWTAADEQSPRWWRSRAARGRGLEASCRNGNVRARAAIGQRVRHRHRLCARHVERGLSRCAARRPQRHRAAARASTPRAAGRPSRRDRRVRRRRLGSADEAAADGSHRRLCASPPPSWRSRMPARRFRAEGDDDRRRGARHVDAPAADRRSSFSTPSSARVRRARRRCSSTAPSPTPRPASPGSSTLRGPNLTVSHKEASGLAAIVTAVDLLREGRATALMAGGVDAIFETFYKAHDRFGVMSAGGRLFPAARAVRHRAERLRARRRRVRPAGSATPRPTAIARPCTARSSASPPRAPPARSTPGRSVRAARPHDAAGARRRRAGAGRGRRGLCVGQRDAELDAIEALALSELFGDTRTSRHLDQGRARRVRRVGRRGVRGGAAVRPHRPRAADCRARRAPIRRRRRCGWRGPRSTRPDRSRSSTASRAAARCSASCSASRAMRTRRHREV